MRNLNMEIHLRGVRRDQLSPLPFGSHQIRRPCIALCCCGSSQWPARRRPLVHRKLETVPSIARGLSASRDCRQCCNHQSGLEECLPGKFSNAILRLSNSCDVSGYSSTACELASEIAGQESELSMSDMIAPSETLLDLLGDSATSN